MNNNGWIRSEDKLPEDYEAVLVIANGRAGNTKLTNAYLLAEYDKDEGFVLVEYPTAENFTVNWWMPLPEPPEGVWI